MFANMTIVGNLGSEARKNGEYYYLNIACKPTMKSETLWVNVRTKADFVANYSKGDRIIASGTPAISVFKDKPSVTIFANTVMNLSPKKQSQDMPMSGEHIPSAENRYSPFSEDDVPF